MKSTTYIKKNESHVELFRRGNGCSARNRSSLPIQGVKERLLVDT